MPILYLATGDGPIIVRNRGDRWETERPLEVRSAAVRNGYAGFVLFHLAFLMILASAFLRERIALLLIRIAFVIVTLGAAGATFLYDAVAIYRIPVLICGAAGIGSLVWYFVMRRRRTKQTA